MSHSSSQGALQHAITAHQQNRLDEAAGLYEEVLRGNGHDIDALNLLGALRHAQGRSEEGAQLITRALQIDANNPPAWFNLGHIYLAHRKYKEATAAFRESVKYAPTRGDFWLALARAYAVTGEHDAARLAAEQTVRIAIAAEDDMARRDAFALLAGANRALNAPERQWEWGYMHTQLAPHDPEAWMQLARMALSHSENLVADTFLARAELLATNNPRQLFEVKWLRTFTLPLPIYANQQQIEAQVLHYTAAVRELHALLRVLPDAALAGLDMLLDAAHPLFLAYTGEDIREAQAAAGDLLCDLMARLYGHQKPQPPQRGKIHIAFVSETFFYHSNMKLRRSWLARLDRSKFHITCYHVGERTDPYTQQIRDMVDVFHHFPGDFPRTLHQLRQDGPDIIQYTNIGLRPLTMKLAALRLAPVQATTWGHPITSGLPTMDYFISSALMEPDGAETHYTEQLVNLPGLSVVPQPIFNVADRSYADKTRADFGLSNDDVVLLCIQSIQKYLPEDDGVYAAIAAQAPKAKFVFVQHAENKAIMDIFRLRIETPFIQRGLDPARHIVMLPFQDQDGYRALHKLADITLDSLGWSGANTTFEALELGGLVMTCPGTFMRGRHTSGCLQLMNMPELIAPDREAYVALAAKLAKDAPLRTQLRKKLREALPLLHTDPGVGEALNAFYLKATKN